MEWRSGYQQLTYQRAFSVLMLACLACSQSAQARTLTSSGASRAASLTLTGATSSMVMAGRFDTTLISGTG